MKPYVVALAGGTCSGKSTLCDHLEKQLREQCSITVLHMDGYFKEHPPTTIAPITRKEYVEHNHPSTLNLDVFQVDFEQALAGDSRIVFVEGLFPLYLDFIREKCDLKIFVDLESDERLARRIKRHLTYGQSLEEIAERYLDTVRFRHNELINPTRWHADMIINGTLDKNKGAEIALHYILSQVQQ